MDYSEFPKEIVEKIASQHLDTVSQLISFSGVCKSWRSAALLLRCPPVLLVPQTAAAAATLSPDAASRGQIHDLVSLNTLIPTTPPPPPPPPIPLPLFPSISNTSDAHGQRDRYRRLHQEYLATFPVIGGDDNSETSSHYDEKSDAHCLASKDGWILRTLPFHGGHRGRQLDLHLLNPLTGASIPLPPLKKEYADVQKAILSTSPDQDDCHVFTFSSWQKNLLAWCKVGPGGGGGGWTFPPRNCLVRVQEDDITEDASYSNGNLYLAGEEALWVVHDVLKPFSAAKGPTVKAFPYSSYMKSFDARNCCPPCSSTHPYLCHLSGGGGGEVRVVLPDYNGDYYGDQLAFHVFKLVDEDGGGGNYWEEVWSLDGHAVFVGAHQSYSLPTKDSAVAAGSSGASYLNPNANGIQGDSIYFALNRVCWDRK